jgi:hypothetical protein
VNQQTPEDKKATDDKKRATFMKRARTGEKATADQLQEPDMAEQEVSEQERKWQHKLLLQQQRRARKQELLVESGKKKPQGNGTKHKCAQSATGSSTNPATFGDTSKAGTARLLLALKNEKTLLALVAEGESKIDHRSMIQNAENESKIDHRSMIQNAENESKIDDCINSINHYLIRMKTITLGGTKW